MIVITQKFPSKFEYSLRAANHIATNFLSCESGLIDGAQLEPKQIRENYHCSAQCYMYILELNLKRILLNICNGFAR